MRFFVIRSGGAAIAWLLAPTAARALTLLRRGDAVAEEIHEDDVDQELLLAAASRDWREGLLLVGEIVA